MTMLRNGLLAAAGLAMAIGSSSNARAGTLPFEINPGTIGGTNANILADQLNFNTVATVTQGATTQTETGFAQLSGLAYQGLGVGNGGLLSTYDLYVTYTSTVALTSFTPGSIGPVTSFTFTMYGDPGPNDTYNGTGAHPTSLIGTVTGNTGDDVVLATGSLYGSSNTAGFNSLGGPVFSVLATFNLTPAGAGVFVDPVPFYDFEFSSSTSSQSANVTPISSSEVAINSIINSSFEVPEPTSLLLLGSSLIGIGGANWRSRRKSKAKSD